VTATTSALAAVRGIKPGRRSACEARFAARLYPLPEKLRRKRSGRLAVGTRRALRSEVLRPLAQQRVNCALKLAARLVVGADRISFERLAPLCAAAAARPRATRARQAAARGSRRRGSSGLGAGLLAGRPRLLVLGAFRPAPAARVRHPRSSRRCGCCASAGRCCGAARASSAASPTSAARACTTCACGVGGDAQISGAQRPGRGATTRVGPSALRRRRRRRRRARHRFGPQPGQRVVRAARRPHVPCKQQQYQRRRAPENAAAPHGGRLFG